jgi:glycosyltransferase involved in cell wall biosynthesis
VRIVHAVRSDSFAGVEQYVALVATELQRRGHEVRVIGGDEGQMSRRLASDVRHVPAESTADVATALLQCVGADLVHVHMSAAELAAIATRARLRAPIVTTRHFAGPRGSGPWAGAMRALARHTITRQVAISEFVRDHVDGKAIVVANGVLDQPAGAFPREPCLLVLSRLAPEKDVATAVRGFADSGLADKGWRLIIVGRGSAEASVRRVIAESGIPSSGVGLRGFVDDVDPLLLRASALVAPAAAEPFGLAVVEAMARATPVLAARGGAHVETVGPDGRLFTPGSAEELAGLMRSLADDPAAAQKYGRELQDRQRGLFGISRHVDGLEAIYRDVLG